LRTLNSISPGFAIVTFAASIFMSVKGTSIVLARTACGGVSCFC